MMYLVLVETEYMENFNQQTRPQANRKVKK